MTSEQDGMDGVRFIKGHGTENDFLILPDPDNTLALTARDVVRLCDRRAGVGADGILRAVRSAAHPDAATMAGAAEWFMDYWNPDGTQGQMCGNGMRVFARYLAAEGLAPAEEFAVATRAGIRQVRLAPPDDPHNGPVTVEMGRPRLPGPADITVTVGERRWPALNVDVGNPHAVAFVQDLAHVGDLLRPPLVSPASAYPHGVTVEFVVALGPGHLALRVHERGVGETRSCGTGAVAAVTAALQRERVTSAPATYTVDVPGGRLHVAVLANGAMELTGPAALVAHGTAHLPHRTTTDPAAPIPGARRAAPLTALPTEPE